MRPRLFGSLWAVVLVALVTVAPRTAVTAGQSPPTARARQVVYVVPINGVIDLGLAPFVERVLDEAATTGAAAVILQVNPFGGRVDAAVVIRDALLRTRVRTVAFVDKRAISAGALISLAAEGIAIDGGTIGAATPVEIGAPGGPGQPVSEKTVSYARKEFRATAESRKRPPLLVEAMVDADVEIPGLNAKGKLLTLTAEPEEERRQIPSAVFGRCPKCGAELVPVPYRGIELDKCSRCQGVWLDFGELDQVVTEDNGLFGSLRRIFVDRATMQAGSRRQMSRGPTP